MQSIIHLPQIELNLESAIVLEFLVSEGDRIAEGQSVIEIETQKATAEVPSEASGYLRKILVAIGDEIGLRTPLAILTDEADEPFTFEDEEVRNSPAGEKPRRPKPEIAKTSDMPSMTTGKVRAAPAARKRARELGLDLQAITGTGPGGRITVTDVDGHLEPSSAANNSQPWTPVPGTRRALIEQMTRGWTEIPQISLMRKMQVGHLMTKSGESSFTSRLIVPLAKALQKHPALRTELKDDRTHVCPVAVAVAMDTPHGLVAPVIHDANSLSLEEISRQIRDYRERGNRNQLKREDLRGGRFAVTNLGMLGVDHFTPLVFHGQTAVLSVGKATAGENGGAEAWCGLAVDHRVVDGSEAARFLETLQDEICRAPE
jgi:pyruvate dehydrogenase E2 component (dihydrolipoamide acetyltransferase)